jgi:hypothetical protein
MSDQSESPEQIPLSAEDMAAIRAACAGSGSGSGPFRAEPQRSRVGSDRSLTTLRAVVNPPA